MLFVDTDQEFLHILFVALISGQDPVTVIEMGIVPLEQPQKFRIIEQPHSFLPVALRQVGKMEQIPDSPDGRIQHPMLHRHHKRKIVFSSVADYGKRALDHIPFLQIFSVEAVKNFCIGAGKLIRHTFHPKMVRDHGSFYIAFRRRKNVKRALIYCPL